MPAQAQLLIMWQRPATVGIDNRLGRLPEPLKPHVIASGSLAIEAGVVGLYCKWSRIKYATHSTSKKMKFE